MPERTVVNEATKPTVAIALDYQAGQTPRVVAKGQGSLAETILATARANGVPIEENPLLAEALSTIELDAEIPEQLYQAVAEVIAFVIRTRDRLG
jgi:flagellar biosynthesis protein